MSIASTLIALALGVAIPTGIVAIVNSIPEHISRIILVTWFVLIFGYMVSTFAVAAI